MTSLRKGGLEPEDIPFICPSHCHWDHVGDPRLWNKSKFLISEESKTLFQPGYPEDEESGFSNDLFPPDRTVWLDTKSDEWKPIGPFSRALDFYKDGSLYIVDSPGHLPGHVNVLARTSEDGAWVYLAGDSVHDYRILNGEAEVALHPIYGCMHVDKSVAEEHIRRIGVLLRMERVRVVLAHDAEWYEENKGGGAFWPGKIESL